MKTMIENQMKLFTCSLKRRYETTNKPLVAKLTSKISIRSKNVFDLNAKYERIVDEFL